MSTDSLSRTDQPTIQGPDDQPAAPSTQSRPYRQPKNAWAIVTRREIMTKLTDKAFVSGTLVTLLLIIGVVVVGILVGERGSTSTIAVTGDDAAAIVAAAHEVEHAKNDKSAVNVVRATDDAQARQWVLDGEADAYLAPADGGGWRLSFERDLDTGLMTTVSQVVQAQVSADLAARAGMTPAELAAATTVQTELLVGDTDRAAVAMLVGFAFAILFFMSAMTFGMQIAGSVVEEKSSRIVEIISAAIPIRHLLAGKILGNTVLGFAQMALFAIVGLVGVAFTPYADLLPSLTSAVVWYLVYFIAGFLALACVWAVAGSLASRQEDLQSTTTPLIMVLMVVYMAGLFATGTLQTILSYVPVISSVLMPQRLMAGTAEWYDLVIGLVLNLVFAALTIVVGEKIYRRSLLQTSGVISYRDALRLTD
ncbi:ABC transporter permease [Aestuariimicrobium sp. Y1814]|uniref:ABC transporter permease n=1 Tax=Aestuariimicrobium sp. Y1814 TaxID=3418742 RepID=UPI003DA7208C